MAGKSLPGRGGRLARSTKAPAKRAPRGSVGARKILDQAVALAAETAELGEAPGPLTEQQVADLLRLDLESVKVLKACCSFNPPRNAAAQVAAIRLRLEFSQPKPKQGVEHSGLVNIRLVDPFAEGPKDG